MLVAIVLPIAMILLTGGAVGGKRWQKELAYSIGGSRIQKKAV